MVSEYGSCELVDLWECNVVKSEMDVFILNYFTTCLGPWCGLLSILSNAMMVYELLEDRIELLLKNMVS